MTNNELSTSSSDNLDSKSNLDIESIYNKPPKEQNFKRQVIYFMEAVGLFIAFYVCRILPLDFSSWLGAKIGRFVGPKIKENNVALLNLNLAFPEKSQEWRENVALDVWENIGRTLGEYPHILNTEKMLKRITFVGLENIEEFLKPDKGGLALSAHFGNWELGMIVSSAVFKRDVSCIYRQPNNPFVNKLFCMRTKGKEGVLIPKGAHSLQRMMKVLANGGLVGLMVDQKLYEGIEASFFGVKAMTTPSPAILATRYGVPIILMRFERIGKQAKFKVVFEKPMFFEKQKASSEEVAKITQHINDIVEDWVREKPEQWLWIHRRWTKDVFEKNSS